MKIIPSPSLPNLKVQRLNMLNKLSSLKGSCIGLNGKDDGGDSNQDQSNVQQSDLERRTVNTNHISTVSSLVATKSDADDGQSTTAKESQRNNFGLYALKFHRNLATHANTMMMNFKRDSCVRSKGSKTDETTATDAIKRNKTIKHRSKHEQFQPCDRQYTNHNIDSIEHYDDEYDEQCSIDVSKKTNRFQRNRQQFKMETANIDYEPSSTRVPIRPKRIKPIAPKANPIVAYETNDTNFTKNGRQYMVHERSQSMDSFESDQNVMTF